LKEETYQKALQLDYIQAMIIENNTEAIPDGVEDEEVLGNDSDLPTPELEGDDVDTTVVLPATGCDDVDNDEESGVSEAVGLSGEESDAAGAADLPGDAVEHAEVAAVVPYAMVNVIGSNNVVDVVLASETINGNVMPQMLNVDGSGNNVSVDANVNTNRRQRRSNALVGPVRGGKYSRH